MKPVLQVIAGGQLPDPPYPKDVMAQGWGFTLYSERIVSSDTWTLTESRRDLRPWLLMLWFKSWTQSPCGSLPADDTLIAAHIGMELRLFTADRDVLMRGWYRCNDGRLYHPVVTELVERMRDSRAKDRDKKAKQRATIAAKLALVPGTVPGDTPGGPPTGTGTVSGTGLSLLSTEGLSPTPPASSTAYTPPDCPHLKVLALWAEVMPDQHQHDPEEWRGARADHLRARWRESACKVGPRKQRWANEQDGLLYFRRLFTWIRESAFLMGRTTHKLRPFRLKLEWVVIQANWAKIIEGSYHEGGE